MASPTIEILRPDVVELIRNDHLRELREAMRALDPADIAELLTDLLVEQGPQDAAVAYRVLPRNDASIVFSYLEPEEQEQLIDELGTDRSVRVVESLDPDDRARLLDELPVEVTRRILRSLRPETRRQTQIILGYPDESVGRLMTPDYVKIRPSWNVQQALEHIRRYGQDAETVHWVYVVAPDGMLIDDIHIRQILLARPEQTIESLCDGRYVGLPADEDREEAVRAMARYDRTALPVVDRLGLLVGIVTYDDIADVAEEEATEDIHKLGGLEALDSPYLSAKLSEMLKKRGGWLTGLFMMQLLTIAVMGVFDEQLEKAVVLAVFVPLIIASGGNTGTQAASLLVRALALDHVNPGDWRKVLFRELSAGLVLGSILGVLGVLTVVGSAFTGLAPNEYPWRVGFAVGTAIVGIVIWGSLAGSLLPLLLHKMGIDPATSSSPLVATIMDVSGLTIYFGVAIVVLGGVML
ncbi:MAG: magnesium transporter [Planctomycetota bacterium]